MRRAALSIAAVVLAFAALPGSTGAASPDCDALHAAQLPAALELDYQQFDQTPGSGFRVLAEAACPRQAADLIEAWIAHTGETRGSPRWHVAQLRGEAGEIDAARDAAQASLRANEAADAPFRWNAHVRAYIAFLDGDRSAFDAALAELEVGRATHAGNAINADFWRRLQPHFALGYAAAQTAD
jgi:hypothetical protein